MTDLAQQPENPSAPETDAGNPSGVSPAQETLTGNKDPLASLTGGTRNPDGTVTYGPALEGSMAAAVKKSGVDGADSPDDAPQGDHEEPAGDVVSEGANSDVADVPVPAETVISGQAGLPAASEQPILAGSPETRPPLTPEQQARMAELEATIASKNYTQANVTELRGLQGRGPGIKDSPSSSESTPSAAQSQPEGATTAPPVEATPPRIRSAQVSYEPVSLDDQGLYTTRSDEAVRAVLRGEPGVDGEPIAPKNAAEVRGEAIPPTAEAARGDPAATASEGATRTESPSDAAATTDANVSGSETNTSEGEAASATGEPAREGSEIPPLSDEDTEMQRIQDERRYNELQDIADQRQWTPEEIAESERLYQRLHAPNESEAIPISPPPEPQPTAENTVRPAEFATGNLRDIPGAGMSSREARARFGGNSGGASTEESEPATNPEAPSSTAESAAPPRENQPGGAEATGEQAPEAELTQEQKQDKFDEDVKAFIKGMDGLSDNEFERRLQEIRRSYDELNPNNTSEQYADFFAEALRSKDRTRSGERRAIRDEERIKKILKRMIKREFDLINAGERVRTYMEQIRDLKDQINEIDGSPIWKGEYNAEEQRRERMRANQMYFQLATLMGDASRLINGSQESYVEYRRDRKEVRRSLGMQNFLSAMLETGDIWIQDRIVDFATWNQELSNIDKQISWAPKVGPINQRTGL